jgi:hypothetical protein
LFIYIQLNESKITSKKREWHNAPQRRSCTLNSVQDRRGSARGTLDWELLHPSNVREIMLHHIAALSCRERKINCERGVVASACGVKIHGLCWEVSLLLFPLIFVFPIQLILVFYRLLTIKFLFNFKNLSFCRHYELFSEEKRREKTTGRRDRYWDGQLCSRDICTTW